VTPFEKSASRNLQVASLNGLRRPRSAAATGEDSFMRNAGPQNDALPPLASVLHFWYNSIPQDLFLTFFPKSFDGKRG
jgi:hypothetical protein